MTDLVTLAIAALFASILTLWAPRYAWTAATAVTLIAGYTAGVMHGPAALWLGALALSASRLHSHRDGPRTPWLLATIVIGLLLGLHALPGFDNPMALHAVVLATGAQPFTQYVNFDKTLAGTLLLGLSGWHAMRAPADWRAAARRALPVAALTIVLAMLASLAIGFVRFEPRWSNVFWTWGPINLLTTCVSEEAFFRGLLQTELTRRLGPRHHLGIVVVSGALFGAAHAAGGWEYVLASTIAGTGYAHIYQRTGRLEMAILAHFSLNAVHFLLFTYPALI